MQPIILISTTLENKADAERIAVLFLARKLIACAQISGPITSIYRWQEVVTNGTEFALSLKTTPECTETVKALLIKEHPYDIPEIMVQEIDHSSHDYAQWVYGEVQQCR
ncbi:divalent-cation tolerance protein CutA [Desulfocastanea catecholica]